MGKIRQLDAHTVNQIAAGEVVERPASVVKELLENAIDAGATQIFIEIGKAGRDLIRIADNGCGMGWEDAKLCLLRHATSKIESVDDLLGVQTLGFRGEALASIASVSRMTLRTAEGDGMRYGLRCEDGSVFELPPLGGRRGTEIWVEDLFYNTPARLKFLKSDATELGACVDIASRLAVAHPNVSIRLNHGKFEVFSTLGAGDMYEAVAAVWGRELGRSLAEVDAEVAGIRLRGFVSPPHVTKSSRSYQFFFVNGRSVRSRSLTVALDQAYRDMTPERRFPVVALSLEIDPSRIDVNVSPTKSEVRFQHEGAAFEALKVAIRGALMEHGMIPSAEAVASANAALALIHPTGHPMVHSMGHPSLSLANGLGAGIGNGTGNGTAPGPGTGTETERVTGFGGNEANANLLGRSREYLAGAAGLAGALGSAGASGPASVSGSAGPAGVVGAENGNSSVSEENGFLSGFQVIGIDVGRRERFDGRYWSTEMKEAASAWKVEEGLATFGSPIEERSSGLELDESASDISANRGFGAERGILAGESLIDFDGLISASGLTSVDGLSGIRGDAGLNETRGLNEGSVGGEAALSGNPAKYLGGELGEELASGLAGLSGLTGEISGLNGGSRLTEHGGLIRPGEVNRPGQLNRDQEGDGFKPAPFKDFTISGSLSDIHLPQNDPNGKPPEFNREARQPFRELLEGLRIVGQVQHTFIIAETRRGLAIIDQHVAHERVLYEWLCGLKGPGGVDRQPLLTPMTLDLDPRAAIMVREQLEEVSRAGFELEPFGGESFLVRAVPTVLRSKNPMKILSRIVEELAEGSAQRRIPPTCEQIWAMAACKMAVKAGDPLSFAEMQKLIEDLALTENPYLCPHGRPITVTLDGQAILKLFKRL